MDDLFLAGSRTIGSGSCSSSAASSAIVLSVFVPTAIFVGTIAFIGIYVSSALLIAIFMRWLGRIGWSIVAGIAPRVPFALFLVFELWFLLPLPKGPLEDCWAFDRRDPGTPARRGRSWKNSPLIAGFGVLGIRRTSC